MKSFIILSILVLAASCSMISTYRQLSSEKRNLRCGSGGCSSMQSGCMGQSMGYGKRYGCDSVSPCVCPCPIVKTVHVTHRSRPIIKHCVKHIHVRDPGCCHCKHRCGCTHRCGC